MRIEVTKEVTVAIEWDDDEVISRCFEDPTWVAAYYDLPDQKAVLDMLAFNAIANGVGDARRLDGWADLDQGQLTMEIVDVW